MSSVKKIVSRVLPFLLMVIIAKGAILMTIYDIDQTVFVNLFCENKDKPEMKCNGHCKLAKISSEETQNKKKSHPGEINFETQIFVYTDFSVERHFEILFTEEAKVNYALKKSVYSYLFTNKHFHPPTV